MPRRPKPFTIGNAGERKASTMSATTLSRQAGLSQLVAAAAAGEPGTEIVISEEPQILLRVVEARLRDSRPLSNDVVLLSVTTTGNAHVASWERVRCERLPVDTKGCRLHCVSIQYGFADDVDVPATLLDAWGRGEVAFDPREARYTCGEEDVRVDPRNPGFMSYWRKLLFGGMARRASSLREHLQLPHARTRTYRIPVSV